METKKSKKYRAYMIKYKQDHAEELKAGITVI